MHFHPVGICVQTAFFDCCIVCNFFHPFFISPIFFASFFCIFFALFPIFLFFFLTPPPHHCVPDVFLRTCHAAVKLEIDATLPIRQASPAVQRQPCCGRHGQPLHPLRDPRRLRVHPAVPCPRPRARPRPRPCTKTTLEGFDTTGMQRRAEFDGHPPR